MSILAPSGKNVLVNEARVTTYTTGGSTQEVQTMTRTIPTIVPCGTTSTKGTFDDVAILSTSDVPRATLLLP